MLIYLSKNRTPGVLCAVLLAGPLTVTAQQKTETFDTQSSASANGWLDYRDQANNERYGWSNSGHAGGAPGEAGGLLVRTGGIRSWYADAAIGKLSLDDYVTISGQVSITQPSIDAPYNIGFFNTNDPAGNFDLLGLAVAEGTGSGAGVGTRFQATVALVGPSVVTHTTTGSRQPGPGETNSFTFTYDPAAGVNSEGRLTLIYSSLGTNYTTFADLSASDRAQGATFNAFGILVRAAGSTDTNTPLGVFLDNVTYTAESSGIYELATGSSLVPGENDKYITVVIPDGATLSGPVSVDLVSTNPGVAYPGAAADGVLTLTFPQNSPNNSTNIPITAATEGSTLFYLTNPAGGTPISTTLASNAIQVVRGTASLTPSALPVGFGENDQAVTVSIVNGLNASGPVTVGVANSDPSVAAPQVSSVTFAQGGATSTNIIVTALAEGSTTLTLTNLVGGGDAGLSGSTLVTVGANPITISPNALVSLVGQTSQTLLVSIPSFANAGGNVTVDLKSLNPSVVTPQGAAGDTLSLTFPHGGTNSLYVPLNVKGHGTATLVLTNNASAEGTTYINNGTVVVTAPAPEGTNVATENFDTQSSAAADGWTDFQDQANGDSYGWSASANAVGSPGEAGGNLVRFAGQNSYYADVTAGPLSLNDSIFASGVLVISPPSSDAAFSFGYFNTNGAPGGGNRSELVIGLADGSYPNSRISAAVGLAGGSSVSAFGPVQLTAGAPVSWSLSYNPIAGATGNGQLALNYNVGGTAYSTNIDLTAAQRFSGATFNAFGILNRNQTTDTSSPLGLYLDNLTYTKGYSLAPVSIPLGVRLAGGQLSFTWNDGGFSLATSTNVTGPYIKIPGATSPFVTNTSGAASGFFRLVWP